MTLFNRREAFFGAALAAWAVPLAARADQAVVYWTGKALTWQQGLTLRAAAEAIMPATDTPGATAAGVAETIDRWVGSWCTKADAATIRGVLDRLDAEAKTAGGPSFADADAEHRMAVLKRADAEPAPAGGKSPFGLLKEYVTVAFFTSRPGATQTLRYDPNPGPYRGCIPVKQVGRAWATS
jgi:hypothetical protein